MKLFQKSKNKAILQNKGENHRSFSNHEKVAINNRQAFDDYQNGLMMNVVQLLEPFTDVLLFGENFSIDHFELMEKLITAEFITGRLDKSVHYAERLHNITCNNLDNPVMVEYSTKALFFLGVISLKRAETTIAIQCFESALEKITNSEHNLPFILLAQIYLCAAKAFAISENTEKMRSAFQNFDVVISSHQNIPEFNALGLYKEALMAFYSYRFGYADNIKFAVEFFSNYRYQIVEDLTSHVKYFDVLEKALLTMVAYFQESKQTDKTIDIYNFAFLLATTDNPSIYSPNDLIWISNL